MEEAFALGPKNQKGEAGSPLLLKFVDKRG